MIKDQTGRWWATCENTACPDFEHPEDLHAHEVRFDLMSRKELSALRTEVLLELARREETECAT